jgi:TolB-like protein
LRRREMKNVQLFVVLSFMAVCCTGAASADDASSPLTVAIFDFESKDKGLAPTGALLRDLVEVNLSGNEGLRMVTRSEMEKILEEQKIGLAGITEEAAPKIGRLLGAQAMIVGRVFPVGDRVYATAKIFGTETSRVYAEKASGAIDDVEALAEDLSAKLIAIVQEKGDTLVAKVHLTKDQIGELKEKLGEGPLPRAFVFIQEQTIAVQTIDPAAQTEFQYILLKTGFESVKDKSGVLKTWVEAYQAEGGKQAPPPIEAADVVFVGEGFSELASRNGDLVSFRARVEIEVLDPSTGQVLAADRETFTAVDLSNQVAAKTALQEAAARLAYRVIPESVERWGASRKSGE